MKIVLNKKYGGFSLPEEFCTQYNMKKYEDINRTDNRLINFIENRGGHVEVSHGNLVVAEIPDESTDWEINEYDGYENITFVLDGKLFHK